MTRWPSLAMSRLRQFVRISGCPGPAGVPQAWTRPRNDSESRARRRAGEGRQPTARAAGSHARAAARPRRATPGHLRNFHDATVLVSRDRAVTVTVTAPPGRRGAAGDGPGAGGCHRSTVTGARRCDHHRRRPGHDHCQGTGRGFSRSGRANTDWHVRSVTSVSRSSVRVFRAVATSRQAA